MALDPELKLDVVDVDLSDYFLLDRNAAFPAEKFHDTFCVEPMPQAEVSGYRRRARAFWLSTAMEAQRPTSTCG